MKEGDIVLSPVMQADGIIKIRPVLLLRKLPPYSDYLICGISSQIHQFQKNYDELITSEHPDFHETGLLTDSIIRLFFLAVIPSNRILGSIGKISPEKLSTLQKRLSDYLSSKG